MGRELARITLILREDGATVECSGDERLCSMYLAFAKALGEGLPRMGSGIGAATRALLDTVLGAVDRYMEVLRSCEYVSWPVHSLTDESYMRLAEHGLVDGPTDTILSDPHYDYECVKFAIRLLEKVRSELVERLVGGGGAQPGGKGGVQG